MKKEFRPVYERGWKLGDDETPQLYDIFLDDEWYGSRRTIQQCEDDVWWIENKDRIIAENVQKELEEKQERIEQKKSKVETIKRSVGDTNKLESICKQLIIDNPKRIEEAKIKLKALDWFVGQVMQQTKEFHPVVIKEIISALVKLSSQH